MTAPRTRIAAVLFTDLVGSTALRARLGEERADAVGRRHDALLADAVARHGGTVVKGLGDGIMATFSAATEAVGAAIAIQQAAHTHRRRRPDEAFAIRIGVSVGDVTWDGADCHGTPVIEAARLCEAAEGGHILVADLVRAIAGSRLECRFTAVGTLALKGLPDPVAVSAIGWLPPDAAIPFPPLLARAELPFVGRTSELDVLVGASRAAREGRRRLALIAGEPGIGKTRLAAELARRMHAEGAVVLYGRCDDEVGVPFQPFVEALRHFVHHVSDDDLRSALDTHAGELARLAPELPERVRDRPLAVAADPETERYRLFEAVSGWLASASWDDPVLLVLDDLHWAAKPTVLLLRHIVRAPEAARLLIVATYRDTEIGRGHPLVDILADLATDAHVDRIALTGLDPVSVTTLVGETAGRHASAGDRAVGDAIHAESEGNPFFVGELLRHVRESGSVVLGGAAAASPRPVTALGVPPALHQVIGRRLNRLSAEVTDALGTAAVIGRDFRLPVLERLVGSDEQRLLRALAEATAARLIEETGLESYRFSHAIVRSTLYDRLSQTHRVRLHRRIAEAIEAVHAGTIDTVLGELAFHFGAAAAGGDVTKALAYTMRAAAHASAMLAHDEAAAYYEKALTWAGDDRLRCELLIRRGEAQRDAGNGAFHRTLVDAAAAAQQCGDADRLARAALSNTRGYPTALTTVDGERVAILEAAIAAISDADGGVRARLLSTLAVELTYAPDRRRRRALCDEALAIARRLGDPATLAHVLRSRFTALLAPDTVMEQLAESAEHVELAGRLDDPREGMWASINRFTVALAVGDIDEADRHLAVLAEIAERVALPAIGGGMWSLRRRQSIRALLAARTADAERLAAEAFAIGRRSQQPDAAFMYSAHVGAIRLVQGRVAEIEPFLGRALATNPDNALTRAFVAALYRELGRDGDARALLEREAVNDFADVPFAVGWLGAMTAYARVAAELDLVEIASRLYPRLGPWHDQAEVTGSTFSGAAALSLGLLAATLGRTSDADGHFAEAQAIHARMRAPYWLALTQIDWARALRDRDPERARDLAGQALAIARAHALGGVERRASDVVTAS